jgi:hypothetical protein
MATQLEGDLYWAEYGGSEEMKDPEFLHEALQRIIFKLLEGAQREIIYALR